MWNPIGDIQIKGWLSYLAAVAMAFVGAYGAALVGMMLMGIFVGSDPTPTMLSIVLWVLFCTGIGFGGVFCGGLCFTFNKRTFGSIILVLLGVGAELYVTLSIAVGRGEPIPWGLIVLTGFGGVLAVLFQRWRRQSKEAEPAASSTSTDPREHNL